VYYRGVRRAAGRRGPAEYFGHGRIGNVWRDESSISQSQKSKWAWFCSITDYVEFLRPVAAKSAGAYYEQISHSRGWQVGVRLIADDTYANILGAAGVSEVLPHQRQLARAGCDATQDDWAASPSAAATANANSARCRLPLVQTLAPGD
jgi:hypothetical protein